MKVYQVRYEGGDHVVEAESFGLAVVLWRAAMIAEFGPDSGWDSTSEPESVTCIGDEPVIRESESSR